MYVGEDLESRLPGVVGECGAEVAQELKEVGRQPAVFPLGARGEVGGMQQVRIAR